MFSFAIRPAHKTQELLLEFRSSSGSDEIISAMKEVLAKINTKLIEKIDLWQNDEIIYKMTSDCGEFELSSNNFECLFIKAPSNQAAIKTIGSALAASGLFQEEAVDYAQYA